MISSFSSTSLPPSGFRTSEKEEFIYANVTENVPEMAKLILVIYALGP